MPVAVPIGAKADEASFKHVADQVERVFTELGGKIGKDLSGSLTEGFASGESAVRSSANKVVNSYDKVADAAGRVKTVQEQLNAAQESGNTTRIVRETERLETARRKESQAIRQTINDLKDYEDQARKASSAFGSGFSSGFSRSRVGGYFADLKSEAESSGSMAGVLAGRAMGAGITAGLATATAGVAAVVGGIGYALTKGFQRYEAIDSAKHRLDNLNKTLASTGKAELDVKAVMDTVNDVVQGTPFSLDAAFGLSTRALSSNTGDLKRFMTVVTDAAGFTGDGIDNIGDAFLQVANTGKVSMEQISNQLRNLPILPWLQAQLGVTGAELQKMISDGKVGLEDLMRAVETNASGFAKSAGDSLEGSISNMQTAVARLGANFLGALFGQPTDDANTLKDAVTALTGKIDELGKWVNDHRDDIRRFFEQGVSVAESLAGAVGFVSDHLGMVAVGVGTVVGAFVAWTTIKGVADLTDNLGKVETLLSKTLPASAASGASKITAALGPVAALLAGLEAVDWRDRLNPNDSRNITNQAKNGQWGRVLIGDAWDWFGFGKDKPGPSTPAPAAPAPNFYKDWYPSAPDVIGGDAVPFVPGPAGSPILPAPGLSGDAGGGKKKGGKAAEPPPYFDPSLWSLQANPVAGTSLGPTDNTSILNARTRVEEARLRLLELESKENVAQSTLVGAKNNVLQAERALREAEAKATEQHYKNLQKHTGELEQIGAKIDQDFGISKGLPGIAENLTKFVANLAFAPALGALQAVAFAGGAGAGGGVAAGMAGAMPAAAAIASGGLGRNVTPYGLPAGTNTGGYGSSGPQFPQWVHDMEQAFGVKASTYADHQESDRHEAGYAPNPQGLNRGIDWSGPVANMQNLANYMASIASGTPGLEQIIWQNPTTMGKVGLGGNGNPTTGYYADYGEGSYAEHQNHVHTRQSTSLPVPGVPSGYGSSHVDSGAYGASAPSVIAGGPQLPVGAAIAGDGASLPLPGLVPGAGQGLASSVPGALGGGVPMPAPIGIATARGPGGGSGLAPTALSPSVGAGGDGAQGIGGMPLDAMMTAASALDVLAPGAGMAAQKGIQLINRAIGYGGQLAGIGVGGLLNTFTTRESPLADMGNSWFGRIASGFAGARPAGKNMAGQSTLPNPEDARKQGGQQAGANTTNNTTNITVEGRNRTDEQLANETAYQNHAIQQYARPGPR
ncbi:tape measure protein [[Mycobacterium] crassicus]|uniref:Tape measure protein n=1 Tax=[Mycobacterium] crassicus TaxID=2872309 RepID=A0ABU5XGA1_9MYCO|nr:tape measure protein [Mycolicibacter sp. MYC098]MEB3021315.1 tape measure protein [Mycolicibacter sp. MYC098]